MSEKPLKAYLEGITKDKLVKKMKIAGLKYTGLDKMTIVGILDEYLQDEQNIGRIWSSLSPFEREYIDEFLKYDEKPAYKKLESIYRKYGIKGSYIRDPWEEQSKMILLFISKSVPPQIKRALKKYLTPIIVKYDTLEQPPADEKYRLNAIGESFAADFCNVINLANSVGLALTKEKQMLSKSAVVKIDMDKNFLKNQVKYISYFSEKYRDYLEPWVEWEEVEGRFIEVVLQEYLSVLGIVDTVVYESKGGCWDYDVRPFFKVEYFRVTPLGAWVLGISKDYHYEEQVTRSGFTVENGFHIKVMNELSNQVHKLFFERFASGEEYPQYCIYKISFGAIVRALDKGISIESIVEYIRIHSYNGIPPELGTLMSKWKRDSDKVVIKNIMIVQMGNSKLMDELQKELNLKQYMANDLSNAFEINPEVAKNIKREVEKKEYYCRIF